MMVEKIEKGNAVLSPRAREQYTFAVLLAADQSFLQRWSYRGCSALLILGLILYYKLTTLALSALYCMQYPDEPVLRLRVDYSVVCFQGAHIAAMVCGVLVLLCVTIGFPVACRYLLIRGFRHDDALTEDVQQARNLESFGVLYRDLKPEYRYYLNYCNMVTLVSALLSVFVNSAPLRMFLAGLVMVALFGYTLTLIPHEGDRRVSEHTVMLFLECLQVCATFMLIIVGYTPATDEDGNELLGNEGAMELAYTFFALLSVGVCACFVAAFLWYVKKRGVKGVLDDALDEAKQLAGMGDAAEDSGSSSSDDDGDDGKKKFNGKPKKVESTSLKKSRQRTPRSVNLQITKEVVHTVIEVPTDVNQPVVIGNRRDKKV
jgi:hypothetical protein